MRPEKSRRGGGFTLLWVSSTLGEFAYSTSLIVLPLIVLALTGSPSQAGIIGFVDAAAMLLAGLPAGAVADRYDRRSVMLWCQAALVAVFGALALLLWADAVSLPALVLLALVNGAATALTMAAGEAMIPSLVAEERLSDAVAMNGARTYAGQLAGTSAGGFLLTATNFFFGTIYFIVIASAQTSGMATGLIGVMAALLGVGGLLGALAAPLLQRALTGARPIHVVLWAFVVLTAGIATLPGSWTPGVLLGAIAFAAPTANAYFTTWQLKLTPDSHRGRVVSVAAIASGGGGAIAPLAGGVVLDVAGRFAGLLGCAAVMAVVALLTSLSPALRHVPELRADESEPPDTDPADTADTADTADPASSAAVAARGPSSPVP
jgi:MFS family permease